MRPMPRPLIATIGALLFNTFSLMLTFALLVPLWSAQSSGARLLSSSSDLVLSVILPVLAAGTPLACGRARAWCRW